MTIKFRDTDISGSFPSGSTFIRCRIVGNVTLASGTATFRHCECTGAYAITADAIQVDRSSAYAILAAGTTVSVLPTNLDFWDPRYGSGNAGALTASSGTTDLSTPVGIVNEYTTITLTGTAVIVNAGRAPVVCNGLLDLSAAPASAIFYGLTAGGNAAADVGGTGAGNNNGQATGGAGTLNGPTGASGVAGAGVQQTALTTLRYGAGGAGGTSGAAGAGVAAGVAGRAGQAFSRSQMPFAGASRVMAGPGTTGTPALTLGASPVEPVYGGGQGGPGSSGGGDNVLAKGGGGGAGGHGGGTVPVRARGIKLSSSTPAAVIAALGGSGGNGGNGATGAGDTGGGSGGGGGGGGDITVEYEWLLGPSAPTASGLKATGGTGGTGGNGGVAGAGGTGGTGGTGGQIVLLNTITGTRTVVLGSAGSAGTANSGTSGGAGGAGGACNASWPAFPGG